MFIIVRFVRILIDLTDIPPSIDIGYMFFSSYIIFVTQEVYLYNINTVVYHIYNTY